VDIRVYVASNIDEAVASFFVPCNIARVTLLEFHSVFTRADQLQPQQPVRARRKKARVVRHL